MAKTYLGIEIGGTKLQLGIGPGDGTLAAPVARRRRCRRRAARHPPSRSTTAVPELLAQAGVARGDCAASASASAARWTTRTRRSSSRTRSRAGTASRLADWINDLVGLPAVLGNDADVAGLAEALFGAGKGLSPIFYITIGSGIGGGLDHQRRDLSRLRPRGGGDRARPHPALARIENQIRTARNECVRVGNRGHGRVYRGQQSKLASFTHYPHAAERAANQRLGCCKGRRIGRSTCKRLVRRGMGKPSGRHLLRHRRICAPGGLLLVAVCSQIGEELLFDPLRKMVADRAFLPFANRFDIVLAELGEEVVVHGALALARKRFQ